MIEMELIFVFGSTLLISASLIPLLKRVAFRFGMVSQPAADRWSARPVPLLGGIAIVSAFICGAVMVPTRAPYLLLDVLLMLLIGLIDDCITLEPLWKLGLQALVVALTTANVAKLTLFPIAEINTLATFLWLLALVNAFNLLDHVDGLSSGVGMVSGAAIGILAILQNQFTLAIQSFALVGALGGFLIYNWNPASIFMGDAGTLPIGLLLGVLSVVASSHTHRGWLPQIAVLLFLVVVPLLDTCVVTITRIANGQAVSRGGRDHSSHRFILLGLSERSAALVLYAFSAIGGGCALVFALMPRHYVIVLLPFALLFFSLSGLFLMDLSFHSTPPSRVYPGVPRVAQWLLRLSYQRRLVLIALDAIIVTAAYDGEALLRFNFQVPAGAIAATTVHLPVLLGATYCALFACGVYREVWRYVGIEDLPRFAGAAALAAGLAYAVFRLGHFPVAGTNLALFSMLLFNLLSLSRLSLRLFSWGLNSLARRQHLTLIVGAGAAAESVARQVGQTNRRHVVGFVDEDPFNHNKLIHGRRVLGSLASLDTIYQQTQFTSILVAEDSLSPDHLERIRRFAEGRKIEVLSCRVREESWLPYEMLSPSESTAAQSA